MSACMGKPASLCFVIYVLCGLCWAFHMLHEAFSMRSLHLVLRGARCNPPPPTHTHHIKANRCLNIPNPPYS